MSVSRKKQAKKYQYVPVKNSLQHPLFTGGCNGVRNIIYEYAFSGDPTWLKSTFTLFNSPSLQWKILTSAYYAAPLKDVESLIRTSHAREEKHLPLTLIKATQQAIRDGDVTLRDDKNVFICEGMANKLMMLYKELYPNQYHKYLTEAKLAAPIETKEEKTVREDRNKAEIKQVFNAVKQNDDKTTEAIKTFKNWANNTSVLNRIHLIYLARKELSERGHELPSVNSEDQGSWYGVLCNQFCFEVIGDAIQRGLPPFMQEILWTGAYNVFNRTACLVREADPDASSFIYPVSFISEKESELGVSALFDEFGVCFGVSGWWQVDSCAAFTQLISSYHDSIQQLLYSDESLVPKARVR